MQEVTLTVHHKSGLHARPAALFVQAAKKFQSDILVGKDEREVDAKSIVSILTLVVNQGSVITIKATGLDEAEAVSALNDLVQSNFGEALEGPKAKAPETDC
jgi:phosphocarrier protein HPr